MQIEALQNILRGAGLRSTKAGSTVANGEVVLCLVGGATITALAVKGEHHGMLLVEDAGGQVAVDPAHVTHVRFR